MCFSVNTSYKNVMRNYKKILSAVLALSLTLSSVAIPTEVQAAGKNLAKGKSVTASAEYNSMPAAYAVVSDRLFQPVSDHLN